MILFTEQTLGGTSADQHGTQCSGTHTRKHTHSLNLQAMDCDVTVLHINSQSIVRPVYGPEYSDRRY